MLTVKVVTEWVGSETAGKPDFDGYIRPCEHVFEAQSVYNDAGIVYCHGVEGFGPPSASDENGVGTVTYQEVQYARPWRQTMYVMNRSGATISKFVLGWHGGCPDVPAQVANPWHPVRESSEKTQSQPEQKPVANGASPA
jgi:hypothetical protein